jgi:hypothetical protein
MDLGTIDVTALAAEFGRFAGVLAMGLAGLRWLVKRYDKQSSEIRSLASRAHEECLNREATIVERLQRIEDEQRGESRTLLHRSARALEINASAMRAFAESKSGVHRALAAEAGSPGQTTGQKPGDRPPG